MHSVKICGTTWKVRFGHTVWTKTSRKSTPTSVVFNTIFRGNSLTIESCLRNCRNIFRYVACIIGHGYIIAESIYKILAKTFSRYLLCLLFSSQCFGFKKCPAQRSGSSLFKHLVSWLSLVRWTAFSCVILLRILLQNVSTLHCSLWWPSTVVVNTVFLKSVEFLRRYWFIRLLIFWRPSTMLHAFLCQLSERNEDPHTNLLPLTFLLFVWEKNSWQNQYETLY